jgi:hypothetical protein
MNVRFEDLEKSALAVLGDDTQGRRIHARLQAAFNYIMISELNKGQNLVETEIVDGLANGFNSILAMLATNMNPELALKCMAQTNAYFKENHVEYVDALEHTGQTATVSH